MGSSNVHNDQAASVALSGSFGAFSGEIQCATNDLTTIILALDTGSGVTSIELVPQVQRKDGTWCDVYKPGDAAMVLDTITVPVAASTNDQPRAFRFDTRGVANLRFNGRVVGGTSGAIRSIDSIRDGSNTPTPRVG